MSSPIACSRCDRVFCSEACFHQHSDLTTHYKPTAVANAAAGCMGCAVLVLILAVCTGIPYFAFRSLRPAVSSLAPTAPTTVVDRSGNAGQDLEDAARSRE